MSFLLPIILQVLAILIGLVEVLIPSFGVLTVIAGSLLISSWWVILEKGSSYIWMFALADLIILPVFIKLIFILMDKSPLTLHSKLPSGDGIDLASNPTISKDLLGKTGQTLTVLRPLGKANFSGSILEVSAEQDMIASHVHIQVIDIQGQKIIVRQI